MITKVQVGGVVKPQELVTIQSQRIQIPESRRLVHLQFRRLAGCPVCSLHLHSFVQRHNEIEAASIREVVVFHSTGEALLPHAGNLPFAVIADPDKRLYAEFGVESALCALLDPRVWMPVLRAVFRSASEILRKHQPVPSLNPQGGRFGLPADFLVAPDGRVLASKYGVHAYDQWSVNELLALAGGERQVHQAGRRLAAGGGTYQS